MSFEKGIREENFSNLPAIIFVGGKNTRAQGLAFLHLVPSKSFLPIDFDENNEPICLFWKNFETLLNLGVKEFYFVVGREGKKVEEYFKRKFGEKANVQYLTKETISQIKTIIEHHASLEATNELTVKDFLVKTEGLNIYIFESDFEGTGEQLLALENVIKNRTFVMVFGDDYFGGEVEEEIKNFIIYALQKIETEKAVEVSAFIEKDKLISEGIFKLDLNKEGKVVVSENPNFIITSLSLFSPSIFKFLKRAGGVRPLDIHSPQVNRKLIEEGKFFGKVINVAFFSNTNTPNNYLQLIERVQHEKRVEHQKGEEKSEFKSKIKI